MKPPPRQVGGADVICFSPIDGRHRPTGYCRHIVGSVVQGPAAGLAICKYEGEECFYLFGCDSEWNTVTDMWHATLEDAKCQAELEYEGVSETWQQHDE
jgi:hypothetical protein